MVSKARICLDCPADISERYGNAKLCRRCAKARQAVSKSSYRASKEVRQAYYQAHKTERKEYQNKYSKDNTEAIAERCRAYYQANAPKKLEYQRVYHKANPEKRREAKARRRARKIELLGKVTSGILDVLLKLQNHRCAAPGCRKRIGKRVRGKSDHHLDHIVPLAKGGLHDDANLQILCATCNQQKHAKDPLAFARERGMLL